MKKLALLFFLGFLTAQVAAYSSSAIVGIMQDKCYPMWTDGYQDAYQQCMDDQKVLDTAWQVVGFDFVYFTRKMIYGY